MAKRKHRAAKIRKRKHPARRKLTLPLLPPLPDQAAFEAARRAFEAGALGEATGYAERALLSNPARADVLAILAACWVRRGDQARALEYARRATEIVPSDPRYWASLGQAHLELRQFREARDAFLRAISADPNMAEAYYALARTETLLGETPAAVDHLVQALSLRAGLADQARREFAGLAGHPALAEWLPEPDASAPKRARRAKRSPKKKRRR